MVKGSRVIIIKEDKILLIHRFKNGKEYYVLPGGSIEKGESLKEAAIREVKEETNLDVDVELLWEYEEDYQGKRKGYYFLAKSYEGDLKLGGEEAKINSVNNLYSLEWFPINEIKKALFYPEEIGRRILKRFI